MMRRPRTQLNNESAQNLMEYTIVLGVIVIILFAMNPFIKRGTQGMVKFVADQVGNQQNSDQSFDDSGHLEGAFTSSNALSQTQTREYDDDNSIIKNGTVTAYSYNDITRTSSTTALNLGYTDTGN